MGYMEHGNEGIGQIVLVCDCDAISVTRKMGEFEKSCVAILCVHHYYLKELCYNPFFLPGGLGSYPTCRPSNLPHTNPVKLDYRDLSY